MKAKTGLDGLTEIQEFLENVLNEVKAGKLDKEVAGQRIEKWLASRKAKRLNSFKK